MSSSSPIGPVDPVSAIPAAQLLTIAGAVDRAIASLDPGTMLAASVASIRDGVATLRVGGQLVQARTDAPLNEGERMLLRVDRAAQPNQIVLKRVDEAPPAESTLLQGVRLTVPSASLATAVSELEQTQDVPALPLAEIELASLPAGTADVLPLGHPQPAVVSGTTLVVAGRQIELPESVPVPDGSAVRATVVASSGGRFQLTLELPTAPANARMSITTPAPVVGPLSTEQSFPAIAVSSDRGTWLQVGERMLPADPMTPLLSPALPPAGAAFAHPVTAQILSVQGGRAEILLAAPTSPEPAIVSASTGQATPAVQLAAQLAPIVGAAAPAAAALLVARGAPQSAQETKLAARILAGQEDPVALMRGLAAMFPAVAQQLEAIEQDSTAGSGKRLKQALARIGLQQEAAALRGDADQQAATLKDAAAPAATLVGAQQLLVAQPPGDLATSYFFLPLPDQGKAELAVEKSKDALHVRGALSMAALGDIGFHLTAHDQGVYAQIDAASSAAVAHLEQAAASLGQALERAVGKPAVVTVSRRAPRPVLPSLPTMLREERLA